MVDRVREVDRHPLLMPTTPIRSRHYRRVIHRPEHHHRHIRRPCRFE
jgi:hypothetical protein